MSHEVEEARAMLRWATDRSSIRAVAEEIGLEQSVLNRFVNGKAQKPRPDVLAKLLPYVAIHRAAWRAAGGAGPLPGNESATDSNGAGGATVTLPLHELTYWRGIVESEWRHIGSTSKALEHLLSMLNDATKGIGRFVESGILPEPEADLTPEELARLAQIRAAIEARKRRERGETGSDEP